MCNCSSANSQPGSISNLYSYATQAGHPNQSGSAAQYSTLPASHTQLGDIRNGTAPPPIEPPAGANFGGPSAGLDSSLMGMLLQILSILLELIKSLSGGGWGGASPSTNFAPKSMVAASPGQQTSMSSSPPGTDGPMGPFTAPGAGLSDAAIAANPAVGKWNKEIAAASKATGLDPDQIGAQIWAESRGNLNTTTRNVDGTNDHGLIQIGKERWLRDIVPNLSADDRAKIKEATGKNAEDLDVTQPMDNVVAGAFHTKGCLAKEGNFERGLRYYNSGDAANAGSAGYVNNIKEYMRELKAGEKLQQDPYNGTFGSGQGGQI